MRYILCALVFLTVSPALAKDNMIRMVKEDGTVVEFEMGRPPEAVSVPEDRPGAEPEPLAVMEEDDDGVKVPMAVIEEKAPPQKIKPPRIIAPPIPPRKPEIAEEPAPEVYTPSPSDRTPGETLITKALALALALDHDAPPARSVQVLPRIHEGRAVFVVQFRTENGLYEMLIDRQSGEIIERGF